MHQHTDGCSFAVKNIGETDVKNVNFKLIVSGDHEDRYLDPSPGLFPLLGGDTVDSYKYKTSFCSHKSIDYLPYKETMHFKICGNIDPYLTSHITGVAVDAFEIVPQSNLNKRSSE